MKFEDALASQVREVGDTLAQHTEVCRIAAKGTGGCEQCAMLKGALLALACVGHAVIECDQFEEAA